MGRTDIARKYMGVRLPSAATQEARSDQSGGSSSATSRAVSVRSTVPVEVEPGGPLMSVVPVASVAPGAPPTCSRTSAAHTRERSASLLLAPAVASPALCAMAPLVRGDRDELGRLGRELAHRRAGLLGEIVDRDLDLVEHVAGLGTRVRGGVARAVAITRIRLRAGRRRVGAVPRTFGGFVVIRVEGIGHGCVLRACGASSHEQVVSTRDPMVPDVSST